MKLTGELSENDLESAVCQFLLQRGYRRVAKVSFDHDGYPNSPDLRENGVTYSATAEVQTEDKMPSERD